MYRNPFFLAQVSAFHHWRSHVDHLGLISDEGELLGLQWLEKVKAFESPAFQQ